MTGPTSPQGRAAELRRDFDSSFAEPATPAVSRVDSLLEVRVGAALYALRVSELSGIVVDVPIAPLPTTVPELLGISSLRRSMLPVYDLRRLLGQAATTPPRWLAIAAAMPVCLAFDRFEGHTRVGPAAIIGIASGDSAAPHVREVVAMGAVNRPVLSVASILDAMTARARTSGSRKE